MKTGQLPMGVRISPEKPSFLLLLYGTLEYDGRAQRLLEVLQALGNVFVVDVAAHGEVIETIVTIPRLSVSLTNRDGKFRRHLRFWRTALNECRRRCPTIIVSANFFTAFPGWIASKLRGARLIYDPHELIIREPSASMNWRDCFWYLLERWSVRRADLVIAANEERARLMADHYCLKQTPTIMRNIPVSTGAGARKDEALQQFPALSRRTPDEVLVLYQGDVSLSRGIDRFVRALTYLGPKYRMIIVGGGPDLEPLRAIGAVFEREGRFVMLGRVPHCRLPAITAMADVGIVTYPYQGLNNIYCAPNKLFEYAQSGLPVVATDQPPLRRLVGSYSIGKLVGEQESPEQLAAVIREVAENKAEYAEALLRFLEGHHWEDEAKRVREAIVGILTKSRCTE